MNRPCVYRAKNSDGVTIYVGMTLNYKVRMYFHQKGSWFDECASIDIIHCRDKAHALAEEKRLILDLKPKFNKQYVVPHGKGSGCCAWTKRRISYEIFRSHVISAVDRSGDNASDETILRICKKGLENKRNGGRADFEYASSVLCLPMSPDEYYGLFK